MLTCNILMHYLMLTVTFHYKNKYTQNVANLSTQYKMQRSKPT